MQINSITSLPKIAEVPGSSKANETNGVSFGDFLQNAMNETNNLQLESTQLTEDFLTGKTDDIHSVMIAGEKANLALQFTMQVRNKVVDAYKEIMNMQV